jgi:molecular chaperone GrpE (heat shock protein)
MTEEINKIFGNEDETNQTLKEDKDLPEYIPEDLNEHVEDFSSGDDDLISLKRIAESLDSINSRLEGIVDNFKQIWQQRENQTQTLSQYLEIVAECQKEIARFANNQFERHALYPAIEVIDVLTRQIKDLLEQANSLPENEFFCPFVRPIVDSIKEAAQIADAKFKSLDMEIIDPKGLDGLDINKHEVRQAIPSSDPTQHKKIQRTLIPGLLYRGKVLRQARVSVYRYVEKEEQNKKGE